MDWNSDEENKEWHVKHRFKETMVIPYSALSNNVSFVMSNGEKTIVTADGIHCKVQQWEEKHICELDDLIRSLYGMGAWDFVLRWHGTCKSMDSMHFLVLHLRKEI